MKIQGPVFTVMTPFKENGEIDYDVLEKYLHRIYDAGGRIFYVTAYSSRYSVLSWEEIENLNEYVIETVKTINSDTIVIIGDPIHCESEISLQFAEDAKYIGADAISLIYGERYYSNEAIYAHYEYINNRVDIPIVIHLTPLVSGITGQLMNWPIVLVDELIKLDNVIAIKEDSKDDDYTEKIIRIVDDRLPIILSGGGKKRWIKFRTEAWLNGISMFEPKLAIKFWEASDLYRCDLYRKIEIPFFEKIVSKYGWQLSIKAAMEARGIMSRRERLPMLAISDVEYLKVVKFMDNLPIEIYI